MPNGNKPLTAIQVFAFVIVLLTISGMVWAIGYSGDFLETAAKVNGLIKFSAAIVVIAIVFIVVFYFVSGTGSTEENATARRDLMAILSKITPMQWVALSIGSLTSGGLLWVIYTGADFFEKPEKARGLITFSVAIVTVAIALLMVFYLVLSDCPEGDDKKEVVKERFTFGKDILMVFVGILGTIMGFYYGADNLSKDQIDSIASVVQKPPGTQDLEQKALDLLLKKDFDGAANAFDDAFSATPALANISNIAAIRKVLTDNKAEFKDATNDAAKQKVWQKIFLEIKTKQLTVGMTDDQKKTVDGYSNPPPSPSPSPSPTASPTP